MIASCLHCQQDIRDCTGPWAGSRYSVSWYHTGTGWERCEGGNAMAVPAPLVNIRCPDHRNRPDSSCSRCRTAADASLHFHNSGRCIPGLCGWPHLLTAAGPAGLG